MPEETMTVTEESVDTNTEVTTEETVQTDDTGQEVETEQQEQEEVTTDSEQSKPVVSEKAAKEISRMAKALQSLQAKNAELESKLSENKSSAKTDDSTDDHPALKGLTPDEDGEYKINGRFYTREEVIDRWETKNQITELSSKLEAKERAEAEAMQKAESEKAQQELQESITSEVKRLRADIMPDIPTDKVDKIDNSIMRTLNEIVTQKLNGGAEFSGELISASIAEALEETRELFGVYGSVQIKDNAKYKAENPVMSTGQSGSKLNVDPLNLSKGEAEKHAIRAAELAMKSRNTG